MFVDRGIEQERAVTVLVELGRVEIERKKKHLLIVRGSTRGRVDEQGSGTGLEDRGLVSERGGAGDILKSDIYIYKYINIYLVYEYIYIYIYM